MQSLTFEHVHKTFLFFERMGFSRPRVGKKDEYAQNDLLAEGEWRELFSRVTPEDFREAARICAKSCHFWPKPADMAGALKTIAEKRAYEASFYQALPEPVNRKPIPEYVKDLFRAQGFTFKSDRQKFNEYGGKSHD